MAIGTILTALNLIKDLAPGVGKVAERFLDGKATEAELDAEADSQELTAEVRIALAQIKLNTQEAAHRSIFVAGWRPFVGWTCAFALFFNFLVFPWVGVFGLEVSPLDLSTMMPVLLGMLGIGGLRSWEKLNGLGKGMGK